MGEATDQSDAIRPWRAGDHLEIAEDGGHGRGSGGTGVGNRRPDRRLRGHVAGIDSGSTLLRARAYLGGNFSPPKHAVLQFDTLLLDDGSDRPIGTVAVSGVPNVKRQVAGGEKSAGKESADANDETQSASPPAGPHSEFRRLADFAMSSARQQLGDTMASVKSIKQPGQMSRLKDTAIQQLPYHPQYWPRGRR